MAIIHRRNPVEHFILYNYGLIASRNNPHPKIYSQISLGRKLSFCVAPGILWCPRPPWCSPSLIQQHSTTTKNNEKIKCVEEQNKWTHHYNRCNRRHSQDTPLLSVTSRDRNRLPYLPYYNICSDFGRNFETMVFRNVLCVAVALTVGVTAFLPTSFPRFNAGSSCRQMSMADLTERNDLRNVAIIGEWRIN